MLTKSPLESGKYEEGTVATLLYANAAEVQPHRVESIHAWLEKIIRNWAHCDGLADVTGRC